MQHVEAATAVLGGDRACGPLPQAGAPATGGVTTPQGGDLRPEDLVRSPAIRVPQRKNVNVGGAGKPDREVPQGGDAPVAGVGTEPGDDKADPHVPSCPTANSV